MMFCKMHLHAKFMQPSNGWLDRWKTSENVSFHKVQGEKEAADATGAAEWINDVFPEMIAGFDSRDVFNADETGLFYKALPSGTMAAKGSQPSGGKVQKERITLLFLCNQSGTEKFIFSIGKSKPPRCFHRVREVPVKYFANTNAWMTSEIWTQILVDFDRKMFSQSRNVVFFIDNAPCHKIKKGSRTLSFIQKRSFSF